MMALCGSGGILSFHNNAGISQSNPSPITLRLGVFPAAANKLLTNPYVIIIYNKVR